MYRLESTGRDTRLTGVKKVFFFSFLFKNARHHLLWCAWNDFPCEMFLSWILTVWLMNVITTLSLARAGLCREIGMEWTAPLERVNFFVSRQFFFATIIMGLFLLLLVKLFVLCLLTIFLLLTHIMWGNAGPPARAAMISRELESWLGDDGDESGLNRFSGRFDLIARLEPENTI